jgi:hypothetical protein
LLEYDKPTGLRKKRGRGIKAEPELAQRARHIVGQRERERFAWLEQVRHGAFQRLNVGVIQASQIIQPERGLARAERLVGDVAQRQREDGA